VQCGLAEHCEAGQNCEANVCVTPAPEPQPLPENNRGDDHGNTAASASVISDISETQGSIEVDADIDYFRFVAGASANYEISTSSNIDTFCALSDSAEALIESNDDGGTGLNCAIISSLQEGATYYVSVRHFSASSTGDYTLNLIRGAQDQGDSVDSAAPVELPAQIAGILVERDHDWFRFTPRANGSYRLETTSNIDTVCDLLDAAGAEITADDDGGAGLNCRIDAQLVAGTTYIFAVRGFSAFTSGDYTMGMAAMP
jgi:tyrosinase